jgi:hypothetical protein
MRTVAIVASFGVGIAAGHFFVPNVGAQTSVRDVHTNRLLTTDWGGWCDGKEVTVEMNEAGPCGTYRADPVAHAAPTMSRATLRRRGTNPFAATRSFTPPARGSTSKAKPTSQSCRRRVMSRGSTAWVTPQPVDQRPVTIVRFVPQPARSQID